METHACIFIFLLLTTTCTCLNAVSEFCKKHVIVEFAHLPPGMLEPTTLEFIETNMSKIRNYYFPQGSTNKGPRPLFAPIALTHIIATKTNATLILKDSVQNSCPGRKESKLPSVLPLVVSHGHVTPNISSIWKKYYNQHRKLSNIKKNPDTRF